MSSDSSAELRPELLDDFYAECDEHLGNLRAHLGVLESSLAKSEANPAALESVYRGVHTFKGNAAIVGLAPAEQLAHATENLLRSLSRRETTLSPETLDLVGRAVHRLEQIVTTFRLQQPIPSIQDLLGQLSAFHPAPTAPAAEVRAAPASPLAPAPASAPSGLTWRATFSPSPALDQRGVNINAVRARLAALGEIVAAAPSIQAGKMSFQFTLALRQVPADLAAWEADGVMLHPEEPAEATAPDPAASSMFIAPSNMVRVDLSRLDELMRIAGEMVINRSRLEERIAKMTGDRSGLQEVNLAFTRSLRDLREAITRVRLVPVAEIFSRLPFAVRDLARDTGKRVRLVLEGQETEVDKYLVERLKEPLLHLVRNAVSHGLEMPAERAAAGKPEEATLRLRAATAGDSVIISIRDDGRGVHAAEVAKRAAAAGLRVPEQLDEVAVLNLLCAPGFSTRDEADRASGRGLGMAVVANTVRELGGSLTLETSPGAWTQFSLRLPLTLSIAETFIVSAGGQTCAVPQSFVEEIVQIEVDHVRAINRVEVAPYRTGLLPLVRLRALFGAEPSPSRQLPVLVVSSERGSAGLVVDRVHSQREVVVRPMQDPLIRVPGISGATELGDGKPVLILDAATLTNGAVRPRPHAAPTLPNQATA